MSLWTDLNAVAFVAVQSAVAAEWLRTGAVHTVRRFLFGREAGPLRVALVTGALAAFLTNDAALIAVLPLVMEARPKGAGVFAYTALAAANSIGAVTPTGNPQNAIIYSHYGVDPFRFLSCQVPVCLSLFLPAALYSWVGDTEKIVSERGGPKPDPPDVIAIIVAAGCLMAHVPVYVWFPPVMACYSLVKPGILREVDWTVVGFLTAGVLLARLVSHLHLVPHLGTGLRTLLIAVGLSQVISNVPAAVALMPATSDWKDLLVGVTVGGFGTPIASLANLIALRAARGWLRDYVIVQTTCLAFGLMVSAVILRGWS